MGVGWMVGAAVSVWVGVNVLVTVGAIVLVKEGVGVEDAAAGTTAAALVLVGRGVEVSVLVGPALGEG